MAEALALALDELLDIMGEDESHPLASLVDIMGDWIEAYDEEHHPMTGGQRRGGSTFVDG